MDRQVVFWCELMRDPVRLNDTVVGATLPAPPYELEDCLTRAGLDGGEEMLVSITRSFNFPFLEPHLEDVHDLRALNALAEKLASLMPWQVDALEGLVLMEEQKEKPFGLPRVYDLAASARECQVLYDVRNDRALGKFYVDNDFIKDTEGLPEAAYKLLDYARIGQRMRLGEGGVFLQRGSGYVTQVGDLIEEFQTLDLTPKAPDYAALLEVGVPDREQSVMLKLPCSEDELRQIPRQLDAQAWYELSWRCADCRVPSLCDAFTTEPNIRFANEASKALAELSEGELRKYKALVSLERVEDLTGAMALRDRLEEYVLTPEYRQPSDVAEDRLRTMLEQRELDMLLPHVNLKAYGQALVEADQIRLTDYGAIDRADGPALGLTHRSGQSAGGMEFSL